MSSIKLVMSVLLYLTTEGQISSSSQPPLSAGVWVFLHNPNFQRCTQWHSRLNNFKLFNAKNIQINIYDWYIWYEQHLLTT